MLVKVPSIRLRDTITSAYEYRLDVYEDTIEMRYFEGEDFDQEGNRFVIATHEIDDFIDGLLQLKDQLKEYENKFK